MSPHCLLTVEVGSGQSRNSCSLVTQAQGWTCCRQHPGLCLDEAGPATMAKLDYLQNYLQIIEYYLLQYFLKRYHLHPIFTIFTAYHTPVLILT